MNTNTLPQTHAHVVPSFSIAFKMGTDDAIAGEICCPEMIFVHPDDVRDYAVGFASVNGHNATTRQLLTDAQIEAEAADYEGDIADREFWAHGC